MECSLYIQHNLTNKTNSSCHHYLQYNADNTTLTSSNYKIASMGRGTDREKSKTKSVNAACTVLIVLTVV